MNSRVSEVIKTIIIWVVLFAVFICVLRIPGVINFLNSTNLKGKAAQKSYDDLEYENSVMRSALLDISVALDEICFDIDDVYDDTFNSNLKAIRKTIRSLESDAYKAAHIGD